MCSRSVEDSLRQSKTDAREAAPIRRRFRADGIRSHETDWNWLNYLFLHDHWLLAWREMEKSGVAVS